MTTPSEDLWEKFIRFTDELQALCSRYQGGMFYDHGKGMVVRFLNGKVLVKAGVLIGVAPGRCQYTHPEEDSKG